MGTLVSPLWVPHPHSPRRLTGLKAGPPCLSKAVEFIGRRSQCVSHQESAEQALTGLALSPLLRQSQEGGGHQMGNCTQGPCGLPLCHQKGREEVVGSLLPGAGR